LKFLRSSRGKVVAGIVLVLLLFLVRPGAQRLHTRIVRSISLALGRPVDVGSVTLRLLPRPGFDLENFVVHEDSEFGAEPVLRSSDVIATLRVSSLLRGRLEIARLSLTEPSINLVRNVEGRWNLEKLIERASSTPVAPTSKTPSEARPGFPYLEADHGRINFKFGQEKKPYSLTEANFALWQDSENTWGVRLKTQPMRTDFNLSDTGLLDVEGSWQRSANLHETPVQFTVLWDGAQLGQLTKLILGQDKGWRGAVKLSVSLTGTPKNLTVETESSVDDFRRYDISTDKALRMAALCSGHYSSTDHIFSGLACRAPVGDGEIALKGSIAPMPGVRAYDLTMVARNLPIQPLVELARRVKKNLPADMVAAGKLDANVTFRRAASAAETEPVWQGGGAVLALNVRSPRTNTTLGLDKIPFAISSNSRDANLVRSEHGSEPRSLASPAKTEARVDVGPFNLALGKPTAATVRGQISHSGYNFLVQGDAEVQRLLEVARTIGLPAPQSTASGDARLSLHVGGSWSGFAAAVVTGTAQLHSVRARIRGLNKPIEIASADIDLTPYAAAVGKVTATAAGGTWRGSLTVPRQCNTPHTCAIRFDLHADEFATDELSGAVSVPPGKQPWYSFLSSAPVQSRPYLASLHAVGKLTAGRVLIHNLAANRVSADVELEQGLLQLSNLRADVLGGRHIGKWQVDFTVNPPVYRGDGTLEKVALGQIAEAMHDDWVTGTANVTYRAGTLGWSKADMLAHADASFQLEARDGSLPHLTLAGESSPLRVNRFVGQLLLRDGKFEIEQGKLQTPGSIYQMSGSATLGRVLDIKLARDGARSFNITGTLNQPRVVMSTSPETQAALKP
jgi:AsmA family/AsmA-like C-terminal region